VRPERQETQVVVVRRSVRPQERHPPAALAGDLLEAEGLAVEIDCAFEVADVQNRVVEPCNRDHASRSDAMAS
jgi:hypothetical protein